MNVQLFLASILTFAGAAACQQPSTEGPRAQTRSSAPAVDAPEAVVAPEIVPAPPERTALDNFQDGNNNGIDDAIDISDMNSLDENNNGIPDEIEADW